MEKGTEGKMSVREALPLSLQHLLAMFVGTIVPPLLIANVAKVDQAGTVMLIQAALFVSAVATFIQIFPLPLTKKIKTGSDLPLMMGMAYVFLGVSISIAGSYGLPDLFGGLLASSILGIFMGFFIGKIKKIFTPLISGVLVICMGIGLFKPAMTNLAGGFGAPSYGEPKNFLVGLFVIFLIMILNKVGRGVVKDASILIGIIAGYIVALPLGMVDYSAVGSASWFALPRPLAYGIEFNPSVILSCTVAYAISLISFLGCATVTTFGGYGRPLKEEEMANGSMGVAFGSIVASLFGSIPVAGLTQNAAIIAMNKYVNKVIFTVAGLLVLLTSLSPKVAAVLITIPNAIVGGATLIIFGMIAISGIGLLTMNGLDIDTKLISAVSIAISIGISYVPGILSQFPESVQMVLGASSIIPGVILALILQGVYGAIGHYNAKKEVEVEKA